MHGFSMHKLTAVTAEQCQRWKQYVTDHMLKRMDSACAICLLLLQSNVRDVSKVQS